MKLFEFFGAALDALWANRLRSALTMIGIVIGTAAVIAIFAVGQSASSSIGALLGSFGNQGIYIFPQTGSRRFVQSQLQWHDMQVVRSDCSRCAKVFPYYDGYYVIRHGHTKDAFEVQSDTDYVTGSLAMAEGRRFNKDDVDGARNVAILLSPAKRKLFADAPGVGKEVRVAGRPFLVIGVIADISAGVFSGTGGSADQIWIPYSTYHRIPGSQLLGLQVYPADGVPPARAIDSVVDILKRLHGTRTQFVGIDVTQQFNAFLSVIAAVAIGISAIGAIALVVGGIGVMNIMLVSVIERTREIGIRKAIGATRTDILLQFIAEAVAITLVGGILGASIGALAGWLASDVLITKLSGAAGAIAWPPILATAFGISFAIGVFFGTYPAVRASRMEPIECLRHE